MIKGQRKRRQCRKREPLRLFGIISSPRREIHMIRHKSKESSADKATTRITAKCVKGRNLDECKTIKAGFLLQFTSRCLHECITRVGFSATKLAHVLQRPIAPSDEKY